MAKKQQQPKAEQSSNPGASQPIADKTQASSATIGWVLTLISFLSGAAVMVVEIGGARYLSPLYGNSIYTWTSIIGVVLIAMGAGAHFGGRWADQWTGSSRLGGLLAVAAVSVALIPALNTLISPLVGNMGMISGPLTYCLLVFTVPGFLLGAVSPVCVRLLSRASNDAHIGASAGTINMAGMIGSFIGTFAGGFVLLSLLDLRLIMLGTAVVLALLALLSWRLDHERTPTSRLAVGMRFVGVFGAAVVLSLTIREAPAENVIHEENNYYHRVRVEQIDGPRGPVRLLKLDSTMEGGMNVDGPVDPLPLEYQNYWKLILGREDFNVKRALFIGAGAFGMPAAVADRWPRSHVDVVEIDPAVVAVGRRFFRLDEFPQVHAHATDGRRFLRQSDCGYDLIFGDAYQGVRSIPSHLVTKEFFQLVNDRLQPEGVFMMNLITALEGEGSALLAALLRTMGEVFPHVEVYSPGLNVRTSAAGGYGMRPSLQLSTVANTIVIAANQPLDDLQRGQFHNGLQTVRAREKRVPDDWLPDLENAPVMTDWRNPVDAIIARQLLR
jgi:spermidine synthase